MTTTFRRLACAALLMAIGGMALGCATVTVHPWDRDLLAEPQMRFVPLPMEYAVDQHIYFSKEGSMGGQDVGGGGCGCN